MTGASFLPDGLELLSPDPIGEGHQGVVYAAVHRRSGTRVALKTLFDLHGVDVHRDLMHEVRLGKRVQPSPHVVRTLGYYAALGPRPPFAVTELIAGRHLRELVAEGRRFTPREVAELGEQAAAGLAKIHDAGIHHNDLHGGNMLLGKDGVLKIGDFGQATAVDPDLSPRRRAHRVAYDVGGLGDALAEMLCGPITAEERVHELAVPGAYRRLALDAGAGSELAGLIGDLAHGDHRKHLTAHEAHARLGEIAAVARCAERAALGALPAVQGLPALGKAFGPAGAKADRSRGMGHRGPGAAPTPVNGYSRVGGARRSGGNSIRPNGPGGGRTL
ncbi:protein kinase domain-containing protein [Embleya sp. NPDC001921]